MNDKIKARLTSNIRSLLNAGWTVGRITDTLSKQGSFGKYDGCTPTAIRELATNGCTALNAEIKAESQAIVAELRRSQDFQFLAGLARSAGLRFAAC